MDPYYDDGQVAIYHADCLDVLPSMSADAVVTDPPYGISDQPLTGTNAHATNTWHPPSDWDREIRPEWCQAAANAARLVVWFGHWRKRDQVERAMAVPLRAEIVWAKDRHVGHPCPLAMRDERIWIFAAQAFAGRTFETTVWDVPGIPSWAFKHHKNQKPISLMRRLLAWLPADSVIDPFMGSGTTLRAAKDLGIRAVGIEAEERYCEIAAKRLAQGVLALDYR